MAAPSPAYVLDFGRLRLADAVFVYLERTIAPGAPLPADVAPRAYGLSPTGVSPSGSVVAAVERGEAIWLGFQAVDPERPATVRVRVDRPEPLDAVTGTPWEEALTDEPRNHLVCPPDSRLTGLRQPAGYVPVGVGERSDAAEVVETLSVFCWGDTPAVVTVELARPATFTRLTGVVSQPLDPDSAYGGWRLP